MRLRGITVLALLALALFGCGPKEQKAESTAPPSESPKPTQPQSANGGGKTIGISVLTMTNPFFKVIADNVTAEAKKNGYETIVVSGEFDVAKQQNQVKDFIVKKVSAIILTPCDSKAIGTSIKEANEAGIPVFTADIEIGRAHV